MSVRNIVKVMNFHSLLRVNNARRKVEQAQAYENELKKLISSLINNRIFVQDGFSLKMPSKGKELNIYIGSDLGFCAGFNSDIINFIKNDLDDSDKIIIGKKINIINDKNVILYMNKEDFPKKYDDIYDAVLYGILNKKYSKLNIIYIHYYNLNKQEVIKKTILPFDFYGENPFFSKERKECDYAVEGNLEFIMWNLVSIYVSTEIKIAELWSWASENVKRQAFTNESLKKIDEHEEIKTKQEKKEKKQKKFSIIVESNNKKITKKMRED